MIANYYLALSNDPVPWVTYPKDRPLNGQESGSLDTLKTLRKTTALIRGRPSKTWVSDTLRPTDEYPGPPAILAPHT